MAAFLGVFSLITGTDVFTGFLTMIFSLIGFKGFFGLTGTLTGFFLAGITFLAGFLATFLAIFLMTFLAAFVTGFFLITFLATTFFFFVLVFDPAFGLALTGFLGVDLAFAAGFFLGAGFGLDFVIFFRRLARLFGSFRSWLRCFFRRFSWFLYRFFGRTFCFSCGLFIVCLFGCHILGAD